jgi:hypothetical protein
MSPINRSVTRLVPAHADLHADASRLRTAERVLPYAAFLQRFTASIVRDVVASGRGMV